MSDGEEPLGPGLVRVAVRAGAPPVRGFDFEAPDLEHLMDLDSEDDDEDDEELEVPRPGAAGQRARDRIPLHHFLRLIAGQGRMDRAQATTNDELVNNLRKMGVIQHDHVARAMKMCPRDVFVPETYREEAFIDSPIRIEDLDFNVSAPHMHGTCLEALNLQPGNRFLDVGSGCGLLTACGAFLVGKTGRVVGIDVRKPANALAKSNLKRLIQENPEYSSVACECRFETHNVFMPSPKHKGQYDRVHVGATCPPDRLGSLLALLGTNGGVIVGPVAPNDLRVITKKADGTVTQRVLSQVRYGDLEIPSDAEILSANMKMLRHERTAVAVPPSSYAADVALITGVGSPSGSSSSDQSLVGSFGDEGGSDSGRRWPKRVAKFLSACGSLRSAGSSSSGSGEQCCWAMDTDSEGGTPRLSEDDLGPHNCTLVGAGFSIDVHRSVLRTRCELFRARCDSGMRDAHDHEITVPEHFPRSAVESFLHYAYADELAPGLDAEGVTTLLHVAHYYGAPRLVGLCELALIGELRTKKGKDKLEEGTADAAAMLLALADDAGLPALKSVALDYIVHHYADVAATESYRMLSKRQSDMIAAEACGLYMRFSDMLKDFNRHDKLPEPGR